MAKKIKSDKVLKQINSYKYLFLDKLVEENDLELVLFIEEAGIDENTEEDLNEILEFATSTKINQIISDEKSKKYKIIFKNYLIYSVTNESFDIWDENEKFEGKLFRKYSKSKFLNYIKSAINSDYAKAIMGEEKYFHFGICCLNHIIDIASPNAPKIEEL